MAGLNEWKGIGYLGRKPELRHTEGGTPVAQFSVACTRKWKNAKGELQEETEWVRVVAWGGMGETAERFLDKGSLVYVSGRLRTTSYEDKDGVKRWTTDVVAESVQFLDRRQGDGRPHPAEQGDDPAAGARTARGADTGKRAQRGSGGPPDDYVPAPGDDEIPF